MAKPDRDLVRDREAVRTNIVVGRGTSRRQEPASEHNTVIQGAMNDQTRSVLAFRYPDCRHAPVGVTLRIIWRLVLHNKWRKGIRSCRPQVPPTLYPSQATPNSVQRFTPDNLQSENILTDCLEARIRAHNPSWVPDHRFVLRCTKRSRSLVL